MLSTTDRLTTRIDCFDCDTPLRDRRKKSCDACVSRRKRVKWFLQRCRVDGVSGEYTIRDFLARSDAQKHKCAKCRKVDRLIPRLAPTAAALTPDAVSLVCRSCVVREQWTPEKRAERLRGQKHPGHSLARLTGWARGSTPGTGMWVGALWCETCQVALNPLALCNRATKAGKGRPCRMMRGKRGCPIHDTLRAQLGADQEKKPGRALWLDAPLKA